jgi:adenylate cyclase
MPSKERILYAAAALLCALITYTSFTQGYFAGPEAALEDTLFSPRPVSTDVVIVAIDDESLIRIGQWPWPRATYAKLLEALTPYEPEAVGIDILFSEPSRLGVQDDARFADALATAPFPVVLAAQAKTLELQGSRAQAKELIEPIPLLAKNADGIGLVNVIADRDGIVRRFAEPVTDASGAAVHSFAGAVLVAAKHFHGLVDLPVINRIVYSGPPGSVRFVSAADLLASPHIQGLDHEFVFIGTTAESLHDSQKTPVSGGTSMQGVEIHAQIANMLHLEYRLTSLPGWVTALWIFCASFASAALLLFMRRFELAIAMNVGLGILYLVAVIILFEKSFIANLVHITLAWLLPTVALSLYRFFSSEKERKMIRQTFSKYVAPHVLTELLAHPERIALGGEEREITVLFSDIRGFTSISENTSPIELVRVLNRYFSAVTKKIFENDGVLDKYIGDAIMAFWGAPIENPHQADKAVEAALGMLEALEALNQEFKASGDPEIKIGIGIYTGRAVVGNIGSEHRFDYTAIGDAVNAASRIEGLTKDFGMPIIIGENTKNKLTKPFVITPLGETSVKGRVAKITIYGVKP